MKGQEGWRWGLLVALLLAGCATSEHRPLPTAQGEASWQLVNKPGMVRYPLALGQIASGAEPFHRVAPLYPPSQLAGCPAPVEVQALLIVDARGHVSAVRVADAATAERPDAHSSPPCALPRDNGSSRRCISINGPLMPPATVTWWTVKRDRSV